MIAIGGALGSISRYGCQKWIYQLYAHPFPFGTFAVNVAGSFLVGLFFALSEKGDLLSAEWENISYNRILWRVYHLLCFFL